VTTPRLVFAMRLKEEIPTGDRRSHKKEEVMFMEHANPFTTSAESVL
jgi:hypothetical protein